VKDLLYKKHIYGLETIIRSVVRVSMDLPYVDREYLHHLIDVAYDSVIKEEA
jgi:hypothetical protein